MDEQLAERVTRLLSGPTGLGTSAARITDALAAPPAPARTPEAAVPAAQEAVVQVPASPLPSLTRKGGHFSPGYAEREWGDGSFPRSTAR